VQANSLGQSLVHDHGSGRADIVRIGGIEPGADDKHDSMDGHSLDREEPVVAVLGDIGGLVAERWVAHKGRSEANAQSEQADVEADGRLVRVVEKLMM
jgi:hypothetical protein